MTAVRSQQAFALFSQLISLPVEERTAWLQRECGADLELYAAVNKLLADDLEASRHSFLSTQPFHVRVQAANSASGNDANGDEMIGREIGAFRVEALVGRGGMGRVYRARRIRDYDQTVAIKFIQAGRASADFAQLFQNEMKLHARVSEHPHIVGLLDAGVTSEQLPYLVMEFVDGIRLDEYCVQHQLNWQGRLSLFHRVCEAVGFAHQQLVIHRDLKPSNVLVDKKGEPKLMDFGIAQTDRSADETTQSILRAFTREYASPEQLRGEALDTRTDIFSLGVILYLLVTGQRPFETSPPQRGGQGTPDSRDLDDQICNADPVPPSQLFRFLRQRGSTSTTGNSDSGFRRALLADMDAIVLKAMAKRPSERYATVAELASDIQRVLDGLPVQARRQTTYYIVSKFARRNRALVTTMTLALVSLLAGITGTALGMRRAEKERQRAEESLQVSFDTVEDLFSRSSELNLTNEPRLQEFRKKLLEQANTHFTSLARRSTDPNRRDIQRRLAVAHHGLGMVASHLNDTEEAMAKFQSALAIREKLVRESPEDQASRRELAITLGMVARTWRVDGKTKIARETYERAREILDAALRDKPGEPQTRKDIAVLFNQLGLLEQEFGDQEAALALFQKDFDQWALLRREHPTVQEYTAGAVRAAINLASAQDRLGDRKVAIKTLEESRPLIRALEEAKYAPDDTAKSLATVENNLAQIAVNEGRLEYAEAAFQRAIDAGRKLVAPKPTSALMLDLADTLTNFASLKVDVKQTDQALALLGEARAIWVGCRLTSPKHPRYPFELASTDRRIGETLLDSRQAAEAQRSLEESLELLQATLLKHPEVKLLRVELPRVRVGLARTLLTREQTAGVVELLDAASSEVSRLRESTPKDFDLLFTLSYIHAAYGELYRLTSEPDKMRRAWEQAVEVLETVAADTPNHPAVRSKLLDLRKRLDNK